MTSGGIGQVASVFLRGTESKHTLVLRDGVRLNSATTGTASLNFLEVGDLDRIEVLKGPSSVLYGTDAIGGVVQLISKRPIQSGAFVSGVYAENNTRKHLIGASLVSETSGLSAQARLHRLKSDGTPVVGKQAFNEDAAFEQKGGSLRLGFDNDILSVSANYASNQGTSEYVDHPWGADYRELSHSFENQLINLTGALHLSLNFSLHARASKFTDDLHQHQSPDFVRSKNREAELYGLWYVNKDHSVLFGSTYRKLGADVLFYSAPYHEEVKSQGYFAQHKYIGDRLNTQLGIRVEDN